MISERLALAPVSCRSLDSPLMEITFAPHCQAPAAGAVTIGAQVAVVARMKGEMQAIEQTSILNNCKDFSKPEPVKRTISEGDNQK
jgi:hypothetical protein